MRIDSSSTGSKCPMGCGGCAGTPDVPPPDAPSGWRMAAWSVGVFWFPVAAAVAGARMGGDDRILQTAYGIGGMVLAAALARIVYLVLKSRGTTMRHPT